MRFTNSFDLHGKTVLLTGAGSGIGAACARLLHAQGANLVLVDINRCGIDGLSKELGAARTLVQEASVTNRSQLDQVVTNSLARFGRIDVVFANAGIACNPPTTIAAADEAEFERVIEVDLLGVWRTVRACLPQIVKNKGHVLVTASIYAYLNGVCNAPYAMSKAGVEMFGRSLRAELAGSGATAGVLYPGWVSTPLTHNVTGGNALATELVNAAYPKLLRRFISPEEVAQAALSGIQKRAPRIMVPSRWIPVSMLRGIFNPLTDWGIDKHKKIQMLVGKLDKQSAR